MELNSEIVGSIDMADNITESFSWGWAVDNAIRSRSPSNLGASPVHSFRSVVDSAIKSRTPSNLGTSPSPLHRFASALLVEGVSNAPRYVAPQLFTLAQLQKATNKFSLHNKIRDDDYRGKLVDGREVTIRREKIARYSFDFGKREFVISSRLHHKNLVRLVGYCEKKDKRLWVYEYMKNGRLYDHLRGECSSVLNSWKMRIKIALDASRGIEYLHNLEVPPIIHGDIRSSNILLDASWTAKVSDGENDKEVTGTFDEYFGLRKPIAKSDVYGLGVVLLELLTGMDARKVDYDIDGLRPPLNLVQYAVPDIMNEDLVSILDLRVGPPDVNEAKALEVVAQTAIRCVEGKDRPTMAEIVVNLERALAICDSSPHDSISSDTISHVSERYIKTIYN